MPLGNVPPGFFNPRRANGAVFLTTATGGMIVSFDGGETWTACALPLFAYSEFPFAQIAWSGGVYCIGVHDSSTFYTLTSTDGITWASHSAPREFSKIAARGTGFIAAVEYEGFWASPDGISWAYEGAFPYSPASSTRALVAFPAGYYTVPGRSDLDPCCYSPSGAPGSWSVLAYDAAFTGLAVNFPYEESARAVSPGGKLVLTNVDDLLGSVAQPAIAFAVLDYTAGTVSFVVVDASSATDSFVQNARVGYGGGSFTARFIATLPPFYYEGGEFTLASVDGVAWGAIAQSDNTVLIEQSDVYPDAFGCMVVIPSNGELYQLCHGAAPFVPFWTNLIGQQESGA